MKRFALLVASAGALALPASGIADPGGRSSEYCGPSANGCEHSGALEGSCAGHGAFGAFGKDNNFAGGANGQLTGYFNSALCGNGGGGTPP